MEGSDNIVQEKQQSYETSRKYIAVGKKSKYLPTKPLPLPVDSNSKQRSNVVMSIKNRSSVLIDLDLEQGHNNSIDPAQVIEIVPESTKEAAGFSTRLVGFGRPVYCH